MKKKILLVATLVFICITLVAIAQPFLVIVTGTVDDESLDEVLPGVNVQIKHTSTASTTNDQGKYIIRAMSNDTLVFSYPGYETQEVPVDERSSIDVHLIAAP